MLIDKSLITKAKEKLGNRNASLIAELLKAEEFDEKNLKSLCPFHQEKTPSFLYNHKNHTMKCFGCDKSVDLIDAYIKATNSTYIEAVKYLFEMAGIKHAFGEHGIQTKRQYRYPKEELPLKENCDVYKYLGVRRISRETIDYAGIQQDQCGNIAFPFRDSNDVLLTMKYRPARKINKGENKCWSQKNADASQILFNMNKVNTTSPLLIVEGEIDALTAIEAGYQNVVSVPFGSNNFGWIEECYDWLDQFESIIICSDNDEAGTKMSKECSFRLGSWRTKIVDIPTAITKPDGQRTTVKDLNEVLFHTDKSTVMSLILNAKDTPVDSVIDYSDIENVDLDQMDGVAFGEKTLDKKLRKLFYGTLTIVTGIRGAGKTSFLCQLGSNAIDAEISSWLFSGEMANTQTKYWIDHIFAGQRNLKQYFYNDEPRYKIDPEAQKQMKKHYKDKLYIYKDSHRNTSDLILKSMEDTVRKYGVKLLIIDNLLKVRFKDSADNLLDEQVKFVDDLIEFALKFNVAVILVIHPHKLETIRRMNTMDIGGRSAVVDLAHRAIGLYKVSADEKEGKPFRTKDGRTINRDPIQHDVIIDVLKDRFTQCEGLSVGAYYDKPSRRFFTDETDLDRRYSWDTKAHTSPLPFPPPQLQNIKEVLGEVKR